MKLGGWGRYPLLEARMTAPRSEAEVAAQVRLGEAIARGNGRAYGDSAVSRRNTIDMRHFNRMLAFDERNGQLLAEAGVLLADIVSVFLPRGWFPVVTPGTKFVTIGGMIAADVHGKNHHRTGGMAHCVHWVDVMDGSGAVQRCSRTENPDLFHWTLGGMGLTGVILRAAIRLRPVASGWIKQQTIPAPNLQAAMAAFDAAQASTYSVAWIDCLGRGAALGRSLVMLGEHAMPDDLSPRELGDLFAATGRRTRSLPFAVPAFVLNRLTVRTFNELYYRKGLHATGTRIVDWDSYFYPLDAIMNWNRIYGRKGFLQFQCVLPLARSRDGLRNLLETISRAGAGSFLAVLKRLGAAGGGMSFPMPGYTLALDFPVNGRTLALMEQLDRITIEHDGRFYLAKDSRMSAATLAASDRRALDFADMRKASGLQAAFQSAQSERLAL